MIRSTSIILILVLSLYEIFAQPLPVQWIRVFSAQGKAADRIADIESDASGNQYIAGYAGRHHGSPDAFAMKCNAQGDTLWTYYYDGGGNREDYATAIVVDQQGNTYITGHSQGTSYSFDCITAKILPNGSQAWIRRYNAGTNTQSYGNALAVDASGNVYVAGYTDPASSSNNWLVIKYNTSGVEQWVDVMNGPFNGEDEALDIAIAPNGNPTVCGFLTETTALGGVNTFVKQYTPLNGTVWTDTWTNPVFTGTDKAVGLGILNNGDVLVGGETRNATNFNRDAFAIRYNSTGVRQWVSIYTDATTSGDEYLLKVAVDQTGSVFFAGTDYLDGYVSCIRSDGTLGWRKKWNGPANGSDVFHGIVVDDSGKVYATGRGVFPGPNYYGNGGLPNLIITKYDVDGDSLWTYRCHDSLNSSMAFAIALRNGKLYAGGFVTDTAYINENFYTIVLDTNGQLITERSINGRGDAVTSGQIILADSQHNIYCGMTVDRLYNEGTDIALIKYNHAGQLLWERYYSSEGFHNDTLTTMQLDPNGHLILSVSSDISKQKNNYRLSLIKYDANGNIMNRAWYNGTGSLLANGMDISLDGNIALAVQSSIQGGLVVYFDTSFNTIWAARIDSTVSSVSRANSLAFFTNGDLAIGGYSQSSGVTAGRIQRYDAQGNRVWASVIDSLNVFDEIRDVTISMNGGVAYTGRSGNTAILGSLDGANGNPLWQRIYNPATSSEYGVKVRYTPAGNIAFICRGWTGFVARYYTVQYSGSGVFQWGNVYSQTASDREPREILVDPDGRVVTAGWAINGTTTNYDYVLVGYNPMGGVSFTNTYNTPLSSGSSWDQLNSLTRDPLGNYIVSGQAASEFYNQWLFKTLTIKYGDMYVGTISTLPGAAQSCHIYPNPSTDGIFNLVDASPIPIIKGSVYDLQGRLITYLDTIHLRVNLGNASPGMYVLVVKRIDGSLERVRLLFQ